MTEAPDLIEPFVGWKGLLADTAGSLSSPAVRADWPARKKFVAACDLHKAHKPPVKSCGCGIYAVKTFEDLKEHGYNMLGDREQTLYWPEQTYVVVQVALWGEVVEGRIGYRAQYAYPQKVWVPSNKLKVGALIRERYGVKLGIIDRYTGRRSA